MRIKCNWCENTMDEGEILVKYDGRDDEIGENHCPYCDMSGYLMDVEGIEETIDALQSWIDELSAEEEHDNRIYHLRMSIKYLKEYKEGEKIC